MPRPRSFEEPEALEAAIDCFWDRGYETTSIRDLTERMGISAPSLYNAFGDKRQLFVLALERYADCRMRERIRRLEEICSPKIAIQRFFEELISPVLYIVPDQPDIEKVAFTSLFSEPSIVRRPAAG